MIVTRIGIQRRAERRPWPGAAWAATLAFAAIFWIWHSPLFYDETLRNNVVYWLMHATTIAAALALWMAVFNSSAPLAFLVLFVTGVQMSLLGALLTFAAVPLFSVHEFTTAPGASRGSKINSLAVS